jgi:choline monooxygenase
LPEWAANRNSFEKLKWKARKSYDLNCNWKVYVDNYLDGGYHVNTVHPALAGVLDYKEYRTVCEGRTVLQSSPTKAAEGAAGRTRTGNLAAYWWLWPNFMINFYSGVMDSNLVLPLGPDRCRVVFDFYFAEGTDSEFVTESVAVADQVQAEDMGICEEVQRGLNSRSYTTGRFSVKRENGGHYFHQMLGRVLQDSC